MMPLLFAGVGEDNIIRKVGGNQETKKHLEDLGFVVGARRQKSIWKILVLWSAEP